MRRTLFVIAILLLGGQGKTSCADAASGINESYSKRIRNKLFELKIAIVTYRAGEGKFPDSLDVLAPREDTDDRRRSSYLEKEGLLDAWGEPFRYEHSGDGFVIWSSGPDRKPGTEDDVFDSNSSSYLESWKAKRAQSVENPATNAVQKATTETAKPPAVMKKKGHGNATAEDGQTPNEHAESKSTPWKIALLIGILIIGAVAVAWCHFKKKRKRKAV